MDACVDVDCPCRTVVPGGNRAARTVWVTKLTYHGGCDLPGRVTIDAACQPGGDELAQSGRVRHEHRTAQGCGLRRCQALGLIGAERDHEPGLAEQCVEILPALKRNLPNLHTVRDPELERHAAQPPLVRPTPDHDQPDSGKRGRHRRKSSDDSVVALVLLESSHRDDQWRDTGTRRVVERLPERTIDARRDHGESLFRVTVRDGLRWAHTQTDADVVAVLPRYNPWWSHWILRVPVLREVVTWNLVLVLRKR